MQDQELDTPQRSSKNWIIPLIVIGLGLAGVAVWLLPDLLNRGNASENLEQLKTEIAQRKQIVLPDGTQIYVNPESTLDYPASFTSKTREIALEGEAYFEIAADNSRPFIIRTGSMITTVLPTDYLSTCYVQAYANQTYVATTMLKGRAQVTSAPDSTTVTAEQESSEPASEPEQPIDVKENQRTLQIKDTKEFHTQDFPSAEKYLKPRIKGKYRFWGQPPSEVLKEIERQYSESVVFKGDFSHCRFYGQLDAMGTLEEFLKRFVENVNATLTKEGDTWVVETKGCEATK